MNYRDRTPLVASHLTLHQRTILKELAMDPDYAPRLDTLGGRDMVPPLRREVLRALTLMSLVTSRWDAVEEAYRVRITDLGRQVLSEDTEFYGEVES